MTYKFYATILFVFTCLLSLHAENTEEWLAKEYTKTIQEEFDISSGGEILISNQYGNVDIESSNRNSVRFEITVMVETNDQSRADELMEKIDIDFTNSSDKVLAETKVNAKKGRKWKKNEKYRINYKVLVPDNSPLKLKNKYGNVAVSTMNTSVSLSLKYGNAHLQDIDGNLELDLGYVKSIDVGNVKGSLEMKASYSKGKIASSGNAVLETKYSHFQIDRAGDVELKSSFDEIEMGAIGALDNHGKYDNVKVSSAESASVETKYSNVQIGSLASSGRFNSGFGQVRIDGVSRTFELLDIKSRYTGYDLYINSPFSLDISTKYTDVKVPDSMNFSERVKDHNSLSLKGTYGSAGTAKITAKMDYGHLRIHI